MELVVILELVLRRVDLVLVADRARAVIMRVVIVGAVGLVVMLRVKLVLVLVLIVEAEVRLRLDCLLVAGVLLLLVCLEAVLLRVVVADSRGVVV